MPIATFLPRLPDLTRNAHRVQQGWRIVRDIPHLQLSADLLLQPNSYVLPWIVAVRGRCGGGGGFCACSHRITNLVDAQDFFCEGPRNSLRCAFRFLR